MNMAAWVSFTNRNNVTVTNAYDLLGRATVRATPGNGGASVGGIEQFFYSPLGLTNYTDALTNRTFMVYDARGRLLYQTNANGEVLRFTYGYEGRHRTGPFGDPAQGAGLGADLQLRRLLAVGQRDFPRRPVRLWFFTGGG